MIRRRIFPLLVVVVATYYAVWGGTYSVFQQWELHRQLQDAELQLVHSRAEVDSLRALEGLLRDDPATIERLARERFGMIRDGELLLRFVDVDSAPSDPQRVARTP